MMKRVRMNTKDTRFKKGHNKVAGRQKGTQNKITRELKEAIITAAEMVGQDGRGKDGLVGYLARIALRNEEVFGRLLVKLLPMQITGDKGGPVQLAVSYSKEELAEKLRERGLPVPEITYSVVNEQAAEEHKSPPLLEARPQARAH